MATKSYLFQSNKYESSIWDRSGMKMQAITEAYKSFYISAAWCREWYTWIYMEILG